MLTLWTLPHRTSDHVPLADLDAAGELAASIDRPGVQVYFGIGSRRAGLNSHQKGVKADVAALPGMWLDIDLAGPAHVAKNLPASLDDAALILDAVPFTPTAIVHSGHGLHAWWLFDTPVLLGGVPVTEFEKTLKTFQGLAHARAVEHGWHIDTGSMSAVTTVLRLPGTTNRKLPECRPVTLLSADGPRYSYSEIRAKIIRPVGRPAKAPTTPGQAPRTPTVVERAPEPVDLNVLIDQLGRLTDPSSAEIGRKLLACESLSEGGGRDAALQSACSILAFLAPWGEIDDLLAIVRPSLELWAAEPDAKRTIEEEEEKARDKLRRAQDDARRKQGDDAEINAEIARAFQAASPGGAPKYTIEELRELCEKIRVPCAPDENPVEKLRKRWIITHTAANYILTLDGYIAPVSKDNLLVRATQDLERAPVDFWVQKADGDMRRRKIGEILEAYSTVALHATVDLAGQVSYYDDSTSVFVEAPCPLLPLEPKEDPRVAAWLQYLGGDHHDKLLDWIATVTMLDLPTCALYLSGPKAAGKTMLAQGLARLWNKGPATDLGQIAGNWTADLTKCPVVLADEALPVQAGKSSAWLRAFVGGGTRTLTRKYLSSISMAGHPRLILAANNDTLLSGQEDIGGDDLAAVASRFLHIVVPKAASEYLAMLGGRVGTRGWVAGGAIARHALWLKETRDVERGGRFLVEGEAGVMHRRLSINGRVASLVCEWLARHLDVYNDQVNNLAAGRIVIGEGCYYVNPSIIVDAWDSYIKSAKVPSARQVGAAIHNLTSDKHVFRGVTLYGLHTDLILEEAERSLIGTPERLHARLHGSVESPLTNGAHKTNVVSS